MSIGHEYRMDRQIKLSVDQARACRWQCLPPVREGFRPILPEGQLAMNYAICRVGERPRRRGLSEKPNSTADYLIGRRTMPLLNVPLLLQERPN